MTDHWSTMLSKRLVHLSPSNCLDSNNKIEMDTNKRYFGIVHSQTIAIIIAQKLFLLVLNVFDILLNVLRGSVSLLSRRTIFFMMVSVFEFDFKNLFFCKTSHNHCWLRFFFSEFSIFDIIKHKRVNFIKTKIKSCLRSSKNIISWVESYGRGWCGTITYMHVLLFTEHFNLND